VRARTRSLAWFAIVAQAVFIGGWAVAGALEHRYSPLRQYISELGRQGAGHAWTFDASVAIWGAGFIALGVAVEPALRARPWPKAMPFFFILAGVSAILVAPLHVDCSPTVNAVCKAHEASGSLSWHHYAHEWASLVINASLLLTPFALVRSAWPSRLARVVLVGAVAILAVWCVTFALHDSFVGYQGLEERLWALVGQLWALACATVMLVEARLDPADVRQPLAPVVYPAPAPGA
jgi:hypothetical protein